MSGWTNARRIEAEGWTYLKPFFEENASQLLLTDKGRIARFLQETVGDLLMRAKTDGALYSVELKVERKASQNLFLESWSNRNLEDRQSHLDRGSNVGWFIKCRADLLFYYFLESDQLHIFDLFKLKRWAFKQRRLYEFPEKEQRTYQQMNDTHGYCVPLEILKREVGFKLIRPRQLAFWKEPVFGGEAA